MTIAVDFFGPMLALPFALTVLYDPIEEKRGYGIHFLFMTIIVSFDIDNS